MNITTVNDEYGFLGTVTENADSWLLVFGSDANLDGSAEVSKVEIGTSEKAEKLLTDCIMGEADIREFI